MAVQWRCPDCDEVSFELDVLSSVSTVRCDSCYASVSKSATLCAVCDAENPWSNRDSVHVWCRTCGHTQMKFSHLRSA